MDTAYKIITIDRLGRKMGLFNYFGFTSAVEYFEGQWVKPKIPNSLLFIFHDLNVAKEWMRSDTELWEVSCEYLRPTPESVLLPSEPEIVAYWKGEKTFKVNSKPIPVITHNTPDFWGCTSLMLNKRIQ
jgi:hypothetical protein